MGKAPKSKRVEPPATLPAGSVATSTLPVKFKGASVCTISRDEIYHRLEWCFRASHDPQGRHVIPPEAVAVVLGASNRECDCLSKMVRPVRILWGV
jgi:hypothetical protein